MAGLSIVTTIIRMPFQRAHLLALENFVSRMQTVCWALDDFISVECWLAQLDWRRRNFNGKFLAKLKMEHAENLRCWKCYSYIERWINRCVNKIVAKWTCCHFSDANSTFEIQFNCILKLKIMHFVLFECETYTRPKSNNFSHGLRIMFPRQTIKHILFKQLYIRCHVLHPFLPRSPKKVVPMNGGARRIRYHCKIKMSALKM